MAVLLNLLVALIVGFLADFILGRIGVSDPLKILVAVLLGMITFFAGLGARLLS